MPTAHVMRQRGTLATVSASGIRHHLGRNGLPANTLASPASLTLLSKEASLQKFVDLAKIDNRQQKPKNFL